MSLAGELRESRERRMMEDPRMKQYVEEARKLGGVPGVGDAHTPFRQRAYVEARLQGKTEEEAIRWAHYTVGDFAAKS